MTRHHHDPAHAVVALLRAVALTVSIPLPVLHLGHLELHTTVHLAAVPLLVYAWRAACRRRGRLRRPVDPATGDHECHGAE